MSSNCDQMPRGADAIERWALLTATVLVGCLGACGGSDKVAGPASGLPTVSAGVSSACGLTISGVAQCWGSNVLGQLGAGATTGPEQCLGKPCSTLPVAVAGGRSFQAVDAADQFACGLTAAGGVYCWGEEIVGELGDGTIVGPQGCSGGSCAATPVAVTGGVVFKALSAGGHFTCGVATGGSAYCWGWNDVGQLGMGTTGGPQSCGGNQCSPSPIAVSGGLAFAALSAGSSSTCGITGNGTAYCWGFNGFGELGDSTLTTSPTPVAVAGGHTYVAVSLGPAASTACGVTAAGAAYCWGENSFGELGAGTTNGPLVCASGRYCSTVPVTVSGGLSFKSVSVGNGFACGITTSGKAYCWGDDVVGELGDSSTTNSATPVSVAGGLVFATVSAGNASACGVTTAGITYCWGSNSFGELGNGTMVDAHVPVPVGAQ